VGCAPHPASRVLEKVALGEEVVIAKAGKPVAQRVPVGKAVHQTTLEPRKETFVVPKDFNLQSTPAEQCRSELLEVRVLLDTHAFLWAITDDLQWSRARDFDCRWRAKPVVPHLRGNSRTTAFKSFPSSGIMSSGSSARAVAPSPSGPLRPHPDRTKRAGRFTDGHRRPLASQISCHSDRVVLLSLEQPTGISQSCILLCLQNSH